MSPGERYIFAGNVKRLNVIREEGRRVGKRVDDVLVDGNRVDVVYDDGRRGRYTRTTKLILESER